MNILIDDPNQWLEAHPNMVKLIQEVIKVSLQEEGFCEHVEIGLILTDDKHIREMNLNYRGIDKATDVLSFPQIDWTQEGLTPKQYKSVEGEIILLGDLVLSTDRLQAQAVEYGHSLERECGFLVAHSILHLLGYDHMETDEKQVMFTKQEAILQRLGLER